MNKSLKEAWGWEVATQSREVRRRFALGTKLKVLEDQGYDAKVGFAVYDGRVDFFNGVNITDGAVGGIVVYWYPGERAPKPNPRPIAPPVQVPSPEPPPAWVPPIVPVPIPIPRLGGGRIPVEP